MVFLEHHSCYYIIIPLLQSEVRQCRAECYPHPNYSGCPLNLEKAARMRMRILKGSNRGITYTICILKFVIRVTFIVKFSSTLAGPFLCFALRQEGDDMSLLIMASLSATKSCLLRSTRSHLKLYT